MRALWLWLPLIALTAGPARAQSPGPISPLAVDLRGFWTGLGRDAATAASLELAPADLPGRGLGGVVDVTVYPLRRPSFALGLGGEALFARGTSQPVDSAGAASGAAVRQRLRNLSGQVSLNFGTRDGWSYLTAGMGPVIFATSRGASAPDDPAPAKSTLNMGGGARWFRSEHLAFTFDVRFYQTRPQDPVGAFAARARTRLLVLSAGVSLR